MFATVLDTAKIALMGKHANKTVHADVYFQHSADYCLKHFFIIFTSFYYSEFLHKTFKEKHGTPTPVTYKIQWLDTPFGHFMRIAHVTVAPSTGAPLFKQA